uniref:Uncharacterized protein n=1 Tax=Anopheles maculatus TaxID=74869 RepID=A0A182T903_9DIPT
MCVPDDPHSAHQTEPRKTKFKSRPIVSIKICIDIEGERQNAGRRLSKRRNTLQFCWLSLLMLLLKYGMVVYTEITNRVKISRASIFVKGTSSQQQTVIGFERFCSMKNRSMG